MRFSMHEAQKPRFGPRFYEIEENFVCGNTQLQNPMFFVANTEECLPKTHRLHAIKRHADEVLKQMSRVFAAASSEQGRPWRRDCTGNSPPGSSPSAGRRVPTATSG